MPKLGLCPHTPQNADGTYADYATNLVDFGGKRISLGEFHAKLREQATNQMKANWFMPGLAAGYNSSSKKAQRIVLEGSVVKPLVEAARDLSRGLTPQPVPVDRSDELGELTVQFNDQRIPLEDAAEVPADLRGYVQLALDLPVMNAYFTLEQGPYDLVPKIKARFKPAAVVTRAGYASYVNHYFDIYRQSIN